MMKKDQTIGEAREELATNLRRFAGSTLNAGDLARDSLLRRARSIRWPFLREPAVFAARRAASVLESVTTKPLAIKAVRAAAEVREQPIPSRSEAYQDALLISVYGPEIPASVKNVLCED